MVDQFRSAAPHKLVFKKLNFILVTFSKVTIHKKVIKQPFNDSTIEDKREKLSLSQS